MPNLIKDKNGVHPQVFKRVDQADTKITPIQINKQFTLTSGSEINSGDPFDDNNDYMAMFANYVTGTPEIGSDGVAYLFNHPEQQNFRKNLNGSYSFSVYHSLNHLFYKYKNDAFKTHGIITPLDKSTKILYQSASVFSIPQKKMGLKVKPGSFIYSGSVNLHSDKYENIIDSAIDTSSYVTNETFYEGFNEYFDITRLNLTSENLDRGQSFPLKPIYEKTSVTQSLSFVPGVLTTNGSESNIGYAAFFTGSSFLKTNIDGIYDRDHDYAISFYICSGSNKNSFDDNIISKTSNHQFRQYPFRIYLSNGKIKYSIAASSQLQFELLSDAHVTSSWTHVVCQKTGSTMQMYINNVLHKSLSSDSLLPTDEIQTFHTASGNISNIHPIKIGGFAANNRNLNGVLDEVRIYNKGLNASDIASLSDRTEGGSLLQTNRVGNAFHNNGIFVISSADYRYNNLLESEYTVKYKSTINIFEFSTLCKIDAGDFNLTTNHSALKDDNETYLSHVTSSNFQPYVTTIGLYNKHAELLAIGKLANPIKNRNDIDTNILVRVDLDQDRFANIKETNELD
jgi:hypothetical protein